MSKEAFKTWLNTFIHQCGYDPHNMLPASCRCQSITIQEAFYVLTNDVFSEQWDDISTTLEEILQAGNDPLDYVAYLQTDARSPVV